MKVAIITHNFPSADGSGRDAGSFVYDFGVALVETGVSVSALCPSTGRPFREAPFEVRSFDYLGSGRKLGHLSFLNPADATSLLSFLRRGAKAAIELAKEARPDIILAMWVVPSGYLAMQAKRATGVPYCVWALGSDLNVYARKPVVGWSVKKTVQAASIRLADGKSLCADLEKLAQAECHFLPSGRFYIDDAGSGTPKQDDLMHFLFVGRLEKVKGIDVLLDALNLLAEEKGKFLVHVVGDGLLRPKIERFLAASGMAGSLVFHATVSDWWLRFFLHGSDYLVVPSRSESVPLVLAEAMNAGLPLLAARVGDFQEIIETFGVGRLFEPGSPAALAEAIRSAIKDGRRAKDAFGSRMSELAQVFDVRRSAARFIEILRGKEIRL